MPVLGKTSNVAVQEAFTSYGDGRKFWIVAIDVAIVNADHITTVEDTLGTDPCDHLSTLYPDKIETYQGVPNITIETLDSDTNNDYVEIIRKKFGYCATTAPVAPAIWGGPSGGSPQDVLMRTENVEDLTESNPAFLHMQIMVISAVLDDKGQISNLKLPVATAAYNTICEKKSKNDRGAGLVCAWP